jgi:hypothetical protein
MRLYVANPTKQTFDFMFRLPDGIREGEDGALLTGWRRDLNRVFIPPGSTVAVGGEMTRAQIDVVLGHHGNYGMMSETDARKAKNRVSLIYSLDRPIRDVARFFEVEETNDDIAAKLSDDMRREAVAAAAGHAQVSNDPVRIMAAEIVEEGKGRGLVQRIDVQREGFQAPEPKRRGRPAKIRV